MYVLKQNEIMYIKNTYIKKGLDMLQMSQGEYRHPLTKLSQGWTCLMGVHVFQDDMSYKSICLE